MDGTDGIGRLLEAYAAHMDAGDFDGIGALFAEGVLADEDGTVLARGAEGVARFYRSITRLHHGRPLTRHMVLDTRLDGPDGDGVVTARSFYLVVQGVDGQEPRPIISGRYVDRVAPVAGAGADHPTGGWRFVERRFLVDLIGDLSRHLTIELHRSPDAREPDPR